MSEKKTFEKEIGGKKLIISTGQFAGQAHGACTVQYGDTLVLATAVMGQKEREGINYFPLLVDFEERLYAAGKIKGSRFIKREGRPSDEAILTSRLVDRTIRPLFEERLRKDVQVVLTVLSMDQENDPDVQSVVAASAALSISPIPWAGPIAGIRIGRINGEWVINPTYEARIKSDFDLVVCGTADKVIMIEAGGNQIEESVIQEAIEFAHQHIQPILQLIEEVRAAVGQQKLSIPQADLIDERIRRKVMDFCKPKLDTLFGEPADKLSHVATVASITEELDVMLKADNEVSKDDRAQALGIVEKLYEERTRAMVLEKDQRVDGRSLNEIRPLSASAGILPRTHGSALFQRGETQILSVVTLGSPGDEQFLDTMELSGKKRYMHHYNFPGFSVGEVAPLRGPGRREIGHGALAEKALLPLLPDKETFPYTVRVVSEVLSSNGSTSQASVCGSSLALMDAGMPISAAVAGISIGLITDEHDESKYKLLTDIQGVEDHSGDMDFKVAGTRKGITAIQMDTKLHGIALAIVRDTLTTAREARIKILDVMDKTISQPRPELSPYAPRIISIKIDPEKIRTIIGKGGETINKIIEVCGGADVMKIDIEDDGLVMITSHSAEMSDRAKKFIEDLTKEVKVGEIYEGKVTQIIKDVSGNEIGAIVEILPGRDGMVHISELAPEHVNKVTDKANIGDTLKVKVMDIDKERNRISLSVNALIEGYEPPPRRPMRSHGGFNQGGPRRGRPIPRRFQ
ncbi:MAG: polyribonucleotide nucleotidyltransferase [Parcubacteria group bacterium]